MRPASSLALDSERLFEGFENLMPFRVQDILLVSSLYDSFILREDGRLSIARSFRKAEWEEYLRQAGIPLDKVRIVRRFASRLCVERVK